MKIKAYMAEFLGTFALVLVGSSSGVLNLSITDVALAFGLILMAMIYALGSVSGGHFNPAVSLGMALSRKITWKDFMFYVVSQLLGSLFAVLLLVPFVGDMGNLATTKILHDFGGRTDFLVLMLGLLIEVVATFFFVFVILKVTSKKENNQIAGLVIGLTLAALILFAGPFTNASINPARSILPALFEGGKALNELWIFIVGPFVGAFLAAMVSPFFETKETA